MGVLHAGILVGGLAAVAVPIIIHLLLRRRKPPMEWGAMRFVLEAYRKTRRRTNLKRWLLLACRCLLLAALAFGLARPLVSGAGEAGAGGRTVWLVIDDGLLGQTTEQGKTDLARAVERCNGVLANLASGDRVGVVLAGVPARGLVTPPSANLAGVRSTLEDLKPTDAPSDWYAALALLSEAVANDRSSRSESDTQSDIVVIAQGARAGTSRVGEPLTRLPAGTRLVLAEPAAAAPGNVAVTGVRALRPVLITGGEGSEAAQTVTVSLRRFGDGVEKAGSTRINVRLAGAEGAVSTTSVQWAAGQRDAIATLVVDTPRKGAGAETGAAVVVAEVETVDAIAGDNAWRLPVLSREALRVGVLADASARGSSASGGTADRFRPGQWVALALRPSESAAVDTLEIEPGAIDAARLSGLDAIVVLSPEAVPAGATGWSRLKSFVDQGGLLLVTPAFEAPAQTWPEAMAAAGLGTTLALGRAPKEYAADALGRIGGGVEQGAGDVLATLRGELESLAKPVTIGRILAPLENAPTDSRDEVRVLLRTADGAPFITLITRKAGDGREASRATPGALVYVSAAFDLKWTDLPAKPLMVPLMQELVRQGVGRARPTFLSVAGARAQAPSGATQLRAMDKNPDQPPVVEPSGRTHDPVRTAGAWRALDAQGADKGILAVNAPGDADTTPVARDRAASWLASALPERGDRERSPEVEWADEAVWTNGLGAVGTAGAPENRSGAGSLVLLAALGLALCEVALARMASASAVRRGTEGAANG